MAIPLPFVWPHAGVYWAVHLWVFAAEWRAARRTSLGSARPSAADAGSFPLILAGIALSLGAAFPLALVPSLQMSPAVAFWGFYLGLTLMVASGLLRRHCWRVLGEHFTFVVHAVEGQPVVTRGAYAWVRHPSYAGSLLIFSGIGMALGSWASAIVMVAGTFAVHHYRMVVEERALVAAIGEPYRAFMRTRKRLIPFVY